MNNNEITMESKTQYISKQWTTDVSFSIGQELAACR